MKYFIVISFLTLLITGCKKSDDHAEDETMASKELVKRFESSYSNGVKGEVVYKSDSSIQSITYTYPDTTIAAEYYYDSGGFLDVIQLNKQDAGLGFSYESDRSILGISLRSSPLGSISDGILSFAYTAEKLVNKCQYFHYNGSLHEKKWTHTYEYNNEKLVTGIKSVNNKNETIVLTIGNYSSYCNIFPEAFMELLRVGDLYELYNYAVLKKMNRLPGKITKTNASGIIERIVENSFDITNGRLNKVTVKNTYPMQPQLNNTYDIKFYY